MVKIHTGQDNVMLDMPFNESSGTAYDISGNGNHGTATGTTTEKSTYDGNYIRKFNGSDNIEILNSKTTFSFIKNTGVFTISFRFALSNYLIDDVPFILSTSTSSSTANGFDLWYENRSTQGSPRALRFSVNKGTSGVGAFWFFLNGAINDNNEHHYMYTNNGGTPELYIDRIKQTATDSGFNGLDTGDNLYDLKIGALQPSNTFPIAGKINNLIISSKYSTEDEAKQEYRNIYRA